jgi:hypothetical protein
VELPATAGTGISAASSASSGFSKSGTGSVGGSASTSLRLGRRQTIHTLHTKTAPISGNSGSSSIDQYIVLREQPRIKVRWPAFRAKKVEPRPVKLGLKVP